MTPDETDLAERLEKLADHLGEEISIDDVKRHEDLRRIVIACDRITNAVTYRALEWAKCQ